MAYPTRLVGLVGRTVTTASPSSLARQSPFALYRCFSTGQNILGSNIKLRDINNKEVTDDFFKGKKVVVFGTPGAYTPVCTNQHLPSFVQNADKLKEAGVDAIVCVAVNDPFVLKAWSEQLKADGKVTVLSDWNAALVKHLGLDIDLSAAGLGVRSKRFSLILDNGKITHQNVEAKPGDFTVTGADTILQQLGRK